MGSPLKLTPKLADALIEQVRKGVPITTAARAAGISDPTVLDWIQAPVVGRWRSGTEISDETFEMLSDFRERVLQAEAEFESTMVDAIASTGFERNEKTGLREWRALSWMANNHPEYGKRYKQNRVTTVQGESTVKHEHVLVRQLSDNELKRALGGADRMPAEDDSAT